MIEIAILNVLLLMMRRSSIGLCEIFSVFHVRIGVAQDGGPGLAVAVHEGRVYDHPLAAVEERSQLVHHSPLPMVTIISYNIHQESFRHNQQYNLLSTNILYVYQKLMIAY